MVINMAFEDDMGSESNPVEDEHADFQTPEGIGNGIVQLPVADELDLTKEECEDLWKQELQDINILELVSMTKQDYFNTCNQVQESLNSLLADEMTSTYAKFSLLFKKFRLTFSHNQKLLGKVLEFKGVKRSLESQNKILLGKLDERDLQEKELQSSYMTIRNAIGEAVEQKNDIERQRDELKEKLSRIPEEILQAAEQYSLSMAFEEKKLLQAQIAALKDKMIFVDEDMKHARKREDLFRKKYHEAKSIQASLEEEIAFVKREKLIQKQLRENAEFSISEKNDKIKKGLSVIKRFQNDIVKLEKDMEAERQARSWIFKEFMSYKKLWVDSKRTVSQLQNDQTARKFHIAVLRAKESQLEHEAERTRAEIHALKVDNSKVSKERSYYVRMARVLEEDFNKLKEEFENSSQTVRHQITEIENLQKEKQLQESDYKEAMKQMMKTDEEFRLARGVIKQLQSEIKILKINNEATYKELEAKARQFEESKLAANRERAEKNNLILEVKDLNAALSESRERIKALEQRGGEYHNKVLQLREQIQIEKDQYKLLHEMHREVTNLCRTTKRELDNTQHLNRVISQRNKNQLDQICSFQDRQDKLEKEITVLKVDVRSARSASAQQDIRCNKLSEELVHQEREKMVALKNASEKEAQLNATRRESKNLASEKEVIKTQLEEKANEMKLKDEKQRLLESDLTKAEKILQERTSDIKLLKNEVENLRRSETLLKNQKSDRDSLRVEINNIHRELNKERLKTKTLEEEINNSQNIHRWRILESEDPARAHLIVRSLKFQKALVKKTDKLKDTEQELQNKNRQVSELQQNLQKLVKAKSEEDTWLIQKQLQECKERIKCLLTENAMFENLTSRQQIEHKELKNEISKLKVSAYEKKLSHTTSI